MKKFRFCILVVCLLSVLTACGESPLDLKLNLKAGESYTMRMTTEQVISQTVEGQEMDMIQTIGMGYTFAVEEVYADGSLLAGVTYDWVAFKQDGDSGSVSYDSENPTDSDDPQTLGFEAMLGKTFHIKLSAKGEVLEIDGFDQLLNDILTDLDLPEGETRDTLETSLQSQFSEESLKSSFQSSMEIYPEGPIEIGDSWNSNFDVNLMVAMSMENTWTLTARENGVAMVDVHSTVSPLPDAEPMDLGFMKMDYAISGEQSGSMTLDEQSGLTLHSKITQNLGGEVTVEIEGLEDSMTWPISIESTIIVEMVKN